MVVQLPHRGCAHRARPLARTHCVEDGRARRPHAVLWADARRGGTQSERLAGPGSPYRSFRSNQLIARIACLALVVVAALVAPAAAQPRVRLIATGGTIANHASGRLTGPQLVAQTPDVARAARVEAETFARGSSLSLTLDDWLRLARRAAASLAEPDVAGVVITGGTDTLEELAWFLDLTVRSDRPVVVTGAIRRPGTGDADGPQNILGAVQVAASPSAHGRGTLVVFNGAVFEARDVEKISTASVNAFGSAIVGSGRVRGGGRRPFCARGISSRHGAQSEFDVAGIRVLPRVNVLLTYQDAPRRSHLDRDSERRARHRHGRRRRGRARGGRSARRGARADDRHPRGADVARRGRYGQRRRCRGAQRADCGWGSQPAQGAACC